MGGSDGEKTDPRVSGSAKSVRGDPQRTPGGAPLLLGSKVVEGKATRPKWREKRDAAPLRGLPGAPGPGAPLSSTHPRPGNPEAFLA